MCGVITVDELVQTDLNGHLPKCFSLYDFASRRSEESFAFALEMMKYWVNLMVSPIRYLHKPQEVLITIA